jgi:hypothetical protein
MLVRRLLEQGRRYLVTEGSFAGTVFQCFGCGKGYFSVGEVEKLADCCCRRCGSTRIDLFVAGEFRLAARGRPRRGKRGKG